MTAATHWSKYSLRIGDQQSALSFLADYGIQGRADQSYGPSLRMLDPLAGLGVDALFPLGNISSIGVANGSNSA